MPSVTGGIRPCHRDDGDGGWELEREKKSGTLAMRVCVEPVLVQ